MSSIKGKYAWRNMPSLSKGKFRKMPVNEVNDPGFHNIPNNLTKDIISDEELVSYGHESLDSFLEDANAFQAWYEDKFSKLDPEERKKILTDIELREEADQGFNTIMSLLK